MIDAIFYAVTFLFFAFTGLTLLARILAERTDIMRAAARLAETLNTLLNTTKKWLMQRTLQQRAREAADRIRCDECGEQSTCTPLMAKACLKGFIRGYVAANSKN